MLERPARPVLLLDHRETADALQQVLEIRRSGLGQIAVETTITAVVAELLAGALLDAGYVVGIQATSPVE